MRTMIDENDFRAAAVVESEAQLRAMGIAQSSTEAGISCCVPTAIDSAPIRRRIKIITVLAAVLGLGGLVVGGLIGALLKRHVLTDSPATLTIAACCSVGGIFFLLLPTLAERRIADGKLRPHVRSLESIYAPSHISLEETQTYGKLKLLAEDVGFIAFFPGSHCLIIYGLSYDYVIYGQNVVHLALHSNRKSVNLAYLIGDKRLDITIVPRSLGAELKRQLAGSSQSMFERIVKTLDRPADQPLFG